MTHLEKTIVLKPTLRCNLRCRYCYESVRGQHKRPKTLLAQIGDIVCRTARCFPGSKILWLLHGGEPLLVGREWFREFCKSVRRVNESRSVLFRIALQTNATLLTDRWIEELERCGDLMGERIVSVSIDGPEDINDLTRITDSGHGAFRATMEAIDRLKSSSVGFTTISVVGQHNAERAADVYHFIRSLRPRFCKFIPCFNYNGTGVPIRHGIRPMSYARFMAGVFDEWMGDGLRGEDGNWFPVDPLATIVSNLSGIPVSWCEYRGEKCDHFTSFYPDGEMWLCDTFDQVKNRSAAFLGNVFDMTDAEFSAAMAKPSRLCSFPVSCSVLSRYCNNCKIQTICKGGCIAHRLGFASPRSALGREYCDSKTFLVEYLASKVRKCDV